MIRKFPIIPIVAQDKKYIEKNKFMGFGELMIYRFSGIYLAISNSHFKNANYAEEKTIWILQYFTKHKFRDSWVF